MTREAIAHALLNVASHESSIGKLVQGGALPVLAQLADFNTKEGSHVVLCAWQVVTAGHPLLALCVSRQDIRRLGHGQVSHPHQPHAAARLPRVGLCRPLVPPV